MSIEDKLQQLRTEWKQNPLRRSIIEEQVKVLKLGQKYPLKIEIDDPFVNNVKEALK